MPPDKLTLLGIFTGIMVLNAFSMLYVWWTYDREPATRFWAASSVLGAVAALSYAFRPYMPIEISVAAGYGAGVSGSFLGAQGLGLFFGRRHYWTPLIAGTAVAAGFGYYWATAAPDLRFVIFASVVVAANLQSVFYLLAPRGERAGHARFLVLTVVLLFMSGWLIQIPVYLGVFLNLLPSRDQTEIYWLVVSTLSGVLFPVGLALLVGERLLDQLRRQARHDALTGMLNRGGFLELAVIELARATRHQRSVSVILADIDHFKRINDSMGHSVGDDVLRQVGARILSLLRREDLCCRYGGEEFCILLPEVGISGAARTAERLRAAFEGHALTAGGANWPITISCGVAAVELPEAGLRDLDQALERADRALYRAKAEGRNRVEIESADSWTRGRDAQSSATGSSIALPR